MYFNLGDSENNYYMHTNANMYYFAHANMKEICPAKIIGAMTS
jgi:hypothetical protein